MGPQAAKTVSERADELEDQMMHELNAKIAQKNEEKIATKSHLFNLADGDFDMVGSATLLAQCALCCATSSPTLCLKASRPAASPCR